MALKLDALPGRAIIYEVGPRDGLQNESCTVATDEKVKLIESLAETGLPAIEMTSFVSPKWIPTLADGPEVARRVRRRPGVRYSALVPNRQGLDAALAAGMEEIAVFMSASETHNRRNVNKTIAQTLAAFEELVPAARAKGAAVRAYVSTVYGCPYEGEVDPKKARAIAKRLLELGCFQISLGDTVGVANPSQVERTLALMLEELPADAIGMHFHDTRGTALANVLVGLSLGISTIDAAAGGLGGCPYAPGAAGNLATEDVVYMLDGMGIETGVDLDKLVDVSAATQRVIGREFPSKVLRATLAVRARARREASH